MRKKAVIIGGGFAGLGIACLLGNAGYQVTVLEKNRQLGGRAGQFRAKGFIFDTGPSWLLMPEVFERFFASVGEQLDGHAELVKLSPSYRVFYEDQQQPIDITSNLTKDAATFEGLESGAGVKLTQYLAKSEKLYELATDHFLYKNYDGLHNLLSPAFLRASFQAPIFSNLHAHVQKYFKNPHLQHILEYPAVFLGASPYKVPTLYSLLSHADMTQGVFYPKGGMYQMVEALVSIGKRYGVIYKTNNEVCQIVTNNSAVSEVHTGDQTYLADLVISDAGIQHTEQQLLRLDQRDYSARYWQNRTLAPSALLINLGVNRTYDSLQHHNLFFSADWAQNFSQIFDKPMFPTSPSLYVCAPSKTDPSVAPKDHENLFVLVPLAAGLNYTKAELDQYGQKILGTVEHKLALPNLQKHIVYKNLFCVKDFADTFNSPSGTGLGLAHTLRQSALFRPKNYSKHVKGLYYVGADVHPGIGLPTTLISAELAFQRICQDTV